MVRVGAPFGSLVRMLCLPAPGRFLPLLALCTPAYAQQDLPATHVQLASACARGTVLVGANAVWVAQPGTPLQMLATKPEGSVAQVLACERGIVLGGDFGITHMPWDKLDQPAEVNSRFMPLSILANGEQVLAVDVELQPWILGPDGAWTRGTVPLPGSRDTLSGQLLCGSSGRWVRTTMVAGKVPPADKANTAEGEAPFVPDDYACFWSDDLATWHAATLPADFERPWQSAADLAAGNGLWAVYLDEGRLLVSKDGKQWERDATPALHDQWIEGFVVVEDKLLVLDQTPDSRGRLHGRAADGRWFTRELPEGAWIQRIFPDGQGVLAIGQRGPSEPPKLMPLEAFFEEWRPEPLPACASLRWLPPGLQLVGLRTVSDQIIADCLGVMNHPAPYPCQLSEQGWRLVYEQEQPELLAAALRSPPATGPSLGACAGDLCARLEADGTIVRTRAGAPAQALQLDGGRRFRALVHGAGQWAALDSEGRLLVSPDASTWRPATSDALRFAHLGGNSTELLAVTTANQVLVWRCPLDKAGDAPALLTNAVERFPRAVETLETQLGEVANSNAFWDGAFDGGTIALLAGGELLLSDDGETFQRTRIVDGPLPMRLQLATHAGRLWTIEWRDESTPEVSKVKSTVRWHEPNGAVAGSRPFLNEVHLDSASDGRIVALLGSTSGTSRINAWINWTADGGQTWGYCLPGVEVAPVHGYGGSGKNSIGGIAHGNGLWVVAGWSKENQSPRAAVAVSRDLVKWETHLLPDTVAAPHTLRFAHGRFIALSQEAKGKGLDVLVSTDGVTWTAKQLSDMPASRLTIGMQRLYLHSGETVLASDDASEWREVVAPRIEPRWMAEVEGMLCYAAAEPAQAGSQAARLRFVRTPAPSKAVHAQASPRFAYTENSMSAQLASFQRLVEGLSYDREVYVELDKYIAELPPITDAYAKEFVLAMFAKRRTPNMIYRLAEVVASQPIRKAAKELLTPLEQSTLREYAAAVQVRRGHLAESIKKLPAPPKSDQTPARVVPLYDLNAAYQRYQQGSAGAAYDLAIAYAEGKGVEKDMNQARIYGEYAVKRLGAQPSMDQLGAAGSITGLYANAIDDYKAGRYAACADKLWSLIDMNAYIAMGTAASMCIFDGSMAVCTVEQAYTWLHWMAVQLGDAEAMNSLGVAVSEGIGVPADENAAIQWYELAAARGSKLAVSNLDSARKRKEYFDGLKAFAENSSESMEIMNEMSDAMGDYAGTLDATFEDTELAASPKYLPGTMLGSVVDGVFQPELYVNHARADGDYRVLVRSTRTWKDRSTTPPTEHTLWRWQMRLAGITELDRHVRADTTWTRCSPCDTRGIRIDAEKGQRLCDGCSGKGFVTGS